MKNITKILLTIFASVAITTASFAGALNVTGDAKASYNIQSADGSDNNNGDKGKALGITNEITFSATGELDNGWAWKYQTELDSGAETTSGAGIDDSQIVFTTDYGTVGLMVSEGSLRGGALGWDVSAFGAGSDNGAGGGMRLGTELSGYNNIQYHTPAGLLPYGIVLKGGQSVNGDTTVNSFKAAGSGGVATAITNQLPGTNATANFVAKKFEQYQISATPLDGLSIIADYGDASGAGVDAVVDHQEPESGHISAKYAIGNATIGLGRGYEALGMTGTLAATTIEQITNTSIGLGYAVNDQLSLSYTQEESDALFTGATNTLGGASVTPNVELEITSIQAAYTMGGMTIALSMDDIENAQYILNRDLKETMLTVALAF
jgi:hypothetical protein